MSLNTEHLLRTISTLEQALLELQGAPSDSVRYDLFRNAAIIFDASLCGQQSRDETT